MTHLQITAVKLGGPDPACCTGLIQLAVIGLGGSTTTAREIARDIKFGAYAYFATIDQQVYDVATGRCLTCEEPFLITDPAADHDNPLLALPRL